MTSTIKLRLVRTCRTCAELTNGKDLMPLFEGASSCIRSREEIFEEIFSFDLAINPDDKLPQQICRKCVQAIESGIEFRKQCKAVQAKLRDDFLHSNPSNDKGFSVVQQRGKIEIDSEQDDVVDRTVPFYESGSKRKPHEEGNKVKAKDKDTLDSLRSNESFLTNPKEEMNIQSDNEQDDKTIDEMMSCVVNLEKINDQDSNKNDFTNMDDPENLYQFDDESHFDETQFEESSIQMKCEVSEDETDNWECEYYIEHDFEKDEFTEFNMQSSVRRYSKRNISASLESTGIEDTDSKNWNNSDFAKEELSADSSTKDEKYNSDIESCLRELLEKSDLENDDEDERKPKKMKFSPEVDNEEDSTKTQKKAKKRTVLRPPIRDLTKKYICKYCDKNFTWGIQLNRHILECKLRTCVNCDFCTVEFETEDLLEKHMDEFHPNGGPPMCPFCSKTFLNNTKRNLHVRQVHTRQNQSCEICGKEFKSKMNLENHKQRYHVATTKIYVCEICNKQFLTDASYKFHLRIHEEGSEKFNCRYCDKATMSLNKLKQHETIHTGERPFLCDICGHSFRYKSDYRRHIATHISGEEHKCEECDLSFPTRRRYLDHMKKQHKESRIQCDLCDKSFRRQELATHHYAAHNGPRPLTKADTKDYPFKCPICSKGFDVAFSLLQHGRIHSLERKHACTYCTSRYKRADHLQLHIKRMHLNIKEHACEVCGKKYLEKCSLKAHMIVHQNIKPFKCPHCPWEFKTERCLTNHMTRHTGEKRFICNICNLCFTNRRLLIIHTETHSDHQRKAIENEVRMVVENDTSNLEMEVCKTDYHDTDLACELFLNVEELTTERIVEVE